MTTDIKIKNFDIEIADGDFVVAESDQQHIEHILITDSGQFRQWPLIGVGVHRYMNASVNKTDIKQRIRTQLLSDNFTVKNISVTNDFDFTIDAKRNEKI